MSPTTLITIAIATGLDVTHWKIFLACTSGILVLSIATLWENTVPDFLPTRTVIVNQDHAFVDVQTSGWLLHKCPILKGSVSGFILAKNNQWRKTAILDVVDSDETTLLTRRTFRVRVRAWDWTVRHREPDTDLESSLVMYYACAGGPRNKLGPVVLAKAK